MSSGERPIGAAKGRQSDTEALCQTFHWTRISSREKMKFTKGNIDLGCFWCANFWVPDPLPPPFPLF